MGSRSAILSSNKGGSGSGRSTTVGHCGLVLAIAARSASANLATAQYGHTYSHKPGFTGSGA
ncbi:hypothetical protein [Microcoleus sp. Pol12B5]|uniref:hypothetical protein n=1 Tax=Microcoleus sp. Pol12B5 TaxID=3055396 RepID=UPI002FD39CA4